MTGVERRDTGLGWPGALPGAMPDGAPAAVRGAVLGALLGGVPGEAPTEGAHLGWPATGVSGPVTNRAPHADERFQAAPSGEGA